MEVSLSSTMMDSEKQNSATRIYQSSHPDLRQLPRMSVNIFKIFINQIGEKRVNAKRNPVPIEKNMEVMSVRVSYIS